MPIPNYQDCMLPVLRALSDGKPHALREIVAQVADDFGLSAEERQEMLPSGRQSVIRNRVGWARTYLGKAQLIESPKRGLWQIADRGHAALGEGPDRIDNRYLSRFEEFVAFKSRSRAAADGQPPAPAHGAGTSADTDTTPEEALEAAYASIRESLEAELLQQVKGGTPEFFENLVVELLVKMGYGGSRREAAERVGRSGDEGIDGIIKEDRLGLDAIYLQAKKWEGTIGRPEIQKFAGALQGQRARKGVFLTTSNFSREAVEYAANIESRIVLIDGETLARLMIDHGLGVTTVDTYEIKRLDSDYFEGE